MTALALIVGLPQCTIKAASEGRPDQCGAALRHCRAVIPASSGIFIVISAAAVAQGIVQIAWHMG
jgi:hypothetical protein